MLTISTQRLVCKAKLTRYFICIIVLCVHGCNLTECYTTVNGVQSASAENEQVSELGGCNHIV